MQRLGDSLKDLVRRTPKRPPTGTLYGPLREEKSEIRLLIVEPGEFADDLDCWLTVASLESWRCPRFETISYCWGDATQRAVLRLNGNLTEVPASSAAAIRRMRLPSRSRTLWIDAICINQRDLEEKAWQITSMGGVFMNGTCNLIYLGEANAGRAPACIRTLQRLVKKIENEASFLTGDDQAAWKRRRAPDSWRYTSILGETVLDLEELSILFSAPWFTRLWVVQELALAHTNTCYWSHVCFSLDDALLLAEVMPWTSSRRLPDAIYTASYMRDFLNLAIPTKHRKGQTFRWRDLYDVATRLSTTEPRDHLFALLGMVQACHLPGKLLPGLIRPDYNKTADEVFRDATRHVLKTEDDYLLRQIMHQHEDGIHQTDRASWCLPWDRSIFSPLAGSNRAGQSTFGSDVGQQPRGLKVETVIDPEVLQVKGLSIGVVDRTTRSTTSQLKDAQVGRRLAEAIVDLSNDRSNSESWQHIRVRAAFLLTCGRLYGGLTRFQDSTQLVQGLTEVLEHEHDGNDIGELGSRFHELILYTAKDRTFFATHTGHLGCGPKLTRNGDVAFIMLGGRYVQILRPVQDYYLYVGAAYVYGMMNGEVFDLNLEPEWVDIR